jgi:hypothetical protein
MPRSGKRITALLAAPPWSTVDRGRTWSTSRGPSPRLFPYKNNSEIDNPQQFCNEALGFLKNQPTVSDFTVRPLEFEK